MIRQDGEDWYQGVSPQIRNVVHVGGYDSPGNAGADRRFGDLGHAGADWFCQNCIGALRWVLDESSNLLGLLYGIVSGIDDLDARPEL